MMYKDYEIDADMFSGMFTVCFCGDEIVFDTAEDAKKFIDEIMA